RRGAGPPGPGRLVREPPGRDDPDPPAARPAHRRLRGVARETRRAGGLVHPPRAGAEGGGDRAALQPGGAGAAGGLTFSPVLVRKYTLRIRCNMPNHRTDSRKTLSLLWPCAFLGAGGAAGLWLWPGGAGGVRTLAACTVLVLTALVGGLWLA